MWGVWGLRRGKKRVESVGGWRDNVGGGGGGERGFIEGGGGGGDIGLGCWVVGVWVCCVVWLGGWVVGWGGGGGGVVGGGWGGGVGGGGGFWFGGLYIYGFWCWVGGGGWGVGVAGIVSSSSEDKLLIALEPEAASVWCKQLPAKGFIRDGQERVQLQEGEQYVVLDCGGGTIDITVHEVLEGGALKELHKASGNNKGGRRVNKRFNQCLREFFCGGLWEDYEREFPKEAQTFVEDLIYHAAPQSRVYKTHIDRSLRQKLKRIEKSQEEGDSLFKPMEGVELEGDKLSVSEKKMESFFHESLVHITDSLCEILDSHSQIQYILLVGGFSQSRILCDHVRQQFSDRARVLCPKNPQEAILKGAVVFARDQAVIRSRKSAFTYGYIKMRRFDPRIHKPEKKLTNADGDWCDDLFGKLVEIGEDVGWNQSVEYILKPITENQTVMDFEFYRTERKSVTYVDEWGVEGPVACCTVAMPDTSKGMDRSVKLEVFFGSTEIRAKATDLESNCTASVKIDFIGK
uniref:Uncharacterized protein n=1 Tax=Knipowitschia caucasica TaxID=637954 RepID=A0AAV2JZG8_KNICA